MKKELLSFMSCDFLMSFHCHNKCNTTNYKVLYKKFLECSQCVGLLVTFKAIPLGFQSLSHCWKHSGTPFWECFGDVI